MRRFLRCALAEWPIARARLLRTRLGLWLLGLVGWFGWLGAGGEPTALPALAVRFGLLASVLAVAYVAGSAADRAALDLSLSHPTTPAAVATGRWLAASAVAALVVATGTCCAAMTGTPAGPALVALACGAVAGGAGAAATLPLAWVGGNTLTAAFFLYVTVLGGLQPAGGALVLPGAAAHVVLDALPSAWRYAALSTGDVAAWVHAGAWIVGGLALALAVLARRT